MGERTRGKNTVNVPCVTLGTEAVNVSIQGDYLYHCLYSRIRIFAKMTVWESEKEAVIRKSRKSLLLPN